MSQDELLASAMRKLLTDDNTYAYVRGQSPSHALWRCDGEADLTPEEAAACEEVHRAGR